jgi:hypothetical protein
MNRAAELLGWHASLEKSNQEKPNMPKAKTHKDIEDISQ